MFERFNVSKNMARAIKRKCDEAYENGVNDVMVIARETMNVMEFEKFANITEFKLKVRVYRG